MLAAWMAGTGCTALREIPRQDYVERVPKQIVHVLARNGTNYELETARVEADTLVGFLRHGVEGPIEEFETVRVPLDDVQSISARRIDWYRTGLIGATAAAVITTVAIRASAHSEAGTTSTGKEIPDLP